MKILNDAKLPSVEGYVETELNGVRQYAALDPASPFLTLGYDTKAGTFVTVQQPITDQRAAKIAELTADTEASIYAGVDVTTSFGAGHYSLTDHDQTNLLFIRLALAGGMTGYVYNADGQDHVFYPAADLTLIINAGAQFITYSRTYLSKLKDWVNRETDLSGITYGAALPADLQTQLNTLLGEVK